MTDPKNDQTGDREWLVNQIAHALRNPIFAASVQTEALQLRAGDPEAVIKTAESLHGQLQRLSDSIDEMLLFGRPVRAELEEVAVAELVATLVGRYRNGDRQEPAEVSADEVDPGLSGRWSRDLLTVILERMLDNAVQHTEAPHRIRLSVVSTGSDTIEFVVRDQGTGIPSDILDDVMLPFFPQHSGRPGLGLAIADKFARCLGGRIEIESEEGSGTVARCVLPLRSDAADRR